MQGGIRPPVRHGQLQANASSNRSRSRPVAIDRLIRRLVHCSEGRLQIHHIGRLREPTRERILDTRQRLQGKGGTVGDRPGAQLAGHRIEADERDLEADASEALCLAPPITAPCSSRMTKSGCASCSLPLNSRHLAREDAPCPRPQLALPVADQSRLAEEGAGQPAPMISDGGFQPRLARQAIGGAIRKVEGAGIHDLRHNRDFLTFAK